MIDGVAPNTGGPGWTRVLGWLAVAAIAMTLIDGVRQTHWKGIHNPNDFVTLYAGSFCLTNHCDPYSVPDLETVLEGKRGTAVVQDWSDQLPIYPPTTLVLLLPLSILSYRSAMVAWYSISFLIYVFGLCWLYFRSPVRGQSRLLVRVVVVLLGLHFPKMLQCLGFGNPSLIVTGLLLFAMFDDAESRRVIRWIALGVACLLKPPLALPLTMLVLFKDGRRVREGLAYVAGLATLMFGMTMYASTLPGMSHWRLDLRDNIELGQRHGMNPSIRASASNAMLHLATLPGFFTRDARVIFAVSAGCVAVLGLLAVWLLWKGRKASWWSPRGYLLAVATVSALTLLPVYHRFCDIGVLLLVVPWVVYEFARRPSWRAWVCAPMLFLLYFSWERRVPIERFTGRSSEVIRFFYFRGDALVVLVLGCVLLSGMYDLLRESTRAQGASVGAT